MIPEIFNWQIVAAIETLEWARSIERFKRAVESLAIGMEANRRAIEAFARSVPDAPRAPRRPDHRPHRRPHRARRLAARASR